jgi:hypothetical protein
MSNLLFVLAIFFLATMRRNDDSPPPNRHNFMICPFPILDVIMVDSDGAQTNLTPLLFLLAFLVFLTTLKKPDETPKTKRSKMHALKILLILSCSTVCAAQLPTTDSLFASLRAFHAETDSVNIEAFKISKKYDWLHWTPQIGVTLGKPSISFSLSQVAANIERKALRNAEKSKILRGGNLAFKSDSFTLVSLLSRLEILKASLVWLESIERIENEKFEIDKQKFENTDITPSDWLTLKASHIRSGEAYFRRREEIQILETEIRKQAKY